MTSGIRFTKDELGYMSLFQSIIEAQNGKIDASVVRDCIIDERGNRVIMVVGEGQIGMAVGKGGKNVKLLSELIKKRVEVVEYSSDPAKFIRNALRPAKVEDVRIIENPDGTKTATVVVKPSHRGIAIGKNGRKANMLRMLAKKYFNIDRLSII